MRALTLLVLAGCARDDLPDVPKLDPCDVTLVSTVPAAGAMDADWRAPLEVRLSGRDDTFAFVTDLAGEHVVSEDGETHSFVPTEPLAPETVYTLGFGWCGGEDELVFQTSVLGELLEVALSGQVYVVDLQGARIVEPTGIGGVASAYLTVDPLLALTDAGDGRLSLVEGFEAADRPDEQDTCLATHASDADFTATPWLVADPADFKLRVTDETFNVYGARLEGTVAPDGTWLSLVLSGETRVEPWARILGGSETDGCDIAVSFGGGCVPCAHDPEESCFPVRIDQIEAWLVDDLVLLDVPDDDCPGCETGAPECPA